MKQMPHEVMTKPAGCAAIVVPYELPPVVNPSGRRLLTATLDSLFPADVEFPAFANFDAAKR